MKDTDKECLAIKVDSTSTNETLVTMKVALLVSMLAGASAFGMLLLRSVLKG